MCFALYIATDDPLPPEDWNTERQRFYLAELSDKDKPVTARFTKPYVYYAGSWQGCGCGWFSDEEPPTTAEEMKELEQTQQCLLALHGLAKTTLENRNTTELFLCWEGSQGDQPRRQIALTLDDLLVDSLPMQELDAYFRVIDQVFH